ncbi:unnamed protein product [Effrenium voratum]|uniref:Uncharacterized protein n=1 Tax=Effrenium voratum TaxID=2562239 RepID=A0AA36HQ82_9DINO|nr:unnamed protein product [Effrenium voratum]
MLFVDIEIARIGFGLRGWGAGSNPVNAQAVFPARFFCYQGASPRQADAADPSDCSQADKVVPTFWLVGNLGPKWLETEIFGADTRKRLRAPSLMARRLFSAWDGSGWGVSGVEMAARAVRQRPLRGGRGSGGALPARYDEGAKAEGLNLFARVDGSPSRTCTPTYRSGSASSSFEKKEDALTKDWPRWNLSTVPKPWAREGFKTKHTTWTAWTQDEDRRSLETAARDMRVQVMSNELARFVSSPKADSRPGSRVSSRR